MAKRVYQPPDGVVRYACRFDREEFWLAHEELEEVWLEEREDLYKGLIQVAAGFLHVERGNWNGARRLFRTALEYLEPYPDRARGFDLDGIRSRIAAALEGVEVCAEGTEEGFDPDLRFEMARYLDADVPDDAVDEVELPYRVRRYDDGYRPGTGSGAEADD